MRILLVEDDAESAGYVLQGLQEAGHNVVIAQDGRDGLFQAAGQDWDLLIVDRMLPQLDGLGMVRTLRAGGIEVPVVTHLTWSTLMTWLLPPLFHGSSR